MFKRLISKILAIFLILGCIISTGCTGIGYRFYLRRLNKVETVGDYTFQQQYIYTYNGESYSISDNKKTYRKQFNLKKGNGAVFSESQIYGDYIYALFYYGAYQIDDDYFNDAILVRAHVKRPKEVEIIDYYKKCPSYYCYLDIKNDLIFVGGGYLFIYNVNNIKPISSPNDSPERMLSFINIHQEVRYFDDYITIYSQKSSNDEIGDLFILENTSIKYELKDFPAGNYHTLYKDYILIDYNSGTVKAYNLKTNQFIDEDSATAIYNEWYNEKNNVYVTPDDDNDTDAGYFEFNGIKYKWSTLTTKEEIQTNEKDSSGNYIVENIYYYDIVITNLETKEEYVLTDAEFKTQAKDVINALKKFTNKNCQTIYSQNGELYFCYYNTEEAWGILYDGTPSIVFKYDEETNKLVYIGYGAAVGYTPIVHKGNLLG